MKRQQPKRKQLTYHQMENVLYEMANALQELMQRINNLEYGISSYIEFRNTGKKFNKWMDKQRTKSQEKEKE